MELSPCFTGSLHIYHGFHLGVPFILSHSAVCLYICIHTCIWMYIHIQYIYRHMLNFLEKHKYKSKTKFVRRSSVKYLAISSSLGILYLFHRISPHLSSFLFARNIHFTSQYCIYYLNINEICKYHPETKLVRRLNIWWKFNPWSFICISQDYSASMMAFIWGKYSF
jgi:hypothetical protein